MLWARKAPKRSAAQKKTELRPLISLLLRRRPKVVLEIGTYRGGTLWLWCRVAARDALIISIDLPGGSFGGGYDEAQEDHFRSFTKPRQKLLLLREDSHDPTTVEKVQAALAGRPIDFLFIDGDHTYDGVRRDFEMYSPLVRAGGVVAFHDIVTLDQGAEVSVFWNELKQRGYEVREFVDSAWGPDYGIGVVFAVPDVPSELRRKDDAEHVVAASPGEYGVAGH